MTHIRTMTLADLPLGMRLKEQAGWNQTEADWRRFLALAPQGCFVAEVDQQPVGTAAVFEFGPVAWVAMVLVDPAARGRGVGTALMRHALAYADERGVKSLRLDATPLGRPIYEKLGFVGQFALKRYAGVAQAVAAPAVATAVEAATRQDWEQLFALDEAVTHTPRRPLLERLFEERPEALRVVREGERIRGFLTTRPGSAARQIGPCIADGDAGAALLADALARCAGQRVYVDVPLEQTAAVELVTGAGLTAQRELTRMCRGETVNDEVQRLWCGTGPEKG